MAEPHSLLGPVLGGLLGFLGAIGAAIIAYFLARQDRVQQTDEERIDDRGQDLSDIPHSTSSPLQGATCAVDDMHHSQ